MRIQSEAEHFVDVSSMPSDMVARMINDDQIQILVNLNGYTKVFYCKFFFCLIVSLILLVVHYNVFVSCAIFLISDIGSMTQLLCEYVLYLLLNSGLILLHHLLIVQGARNEIFAMQPAPIQVSYMGFPGTTGASYIQYLVTDEVRSWKFTSSDYLLCILICT